MIANLDTRQVVYLCLNSNVQDVLGQVPVSYTPQVLLLRQPPPITTVPSSDVKLG